MSQKEERFSEEAKRLQEIIIKELEEHKEKFIKDVDNLFEGMKLEQNKNDFDINMDSMIKLYSKYIGKLKEYYSEYRKLTTAISQKKKDYLDSEILMEQRNFMSNFEEKLEEENKRRFEIRDEYKNMSEEEMRKDAESIITKRTKTYNPLSTVGHRVEITDDGYTFFDNDFQKNFPTISKTIKEVIQVEDKDRKLIYNTKEILKKSCSVGTLSALLGMIRSVFENSPEFATNALLCFGTVGAIGMAIGGISESIKYKKAMLNYEENVELLKKYDLYDSLEMIIDKSREREFNSKEEYRERGKAL